MTHDLTTSLRRTSRVRRSLLVGAVTASLGVTAACGIAAQNTAGTSTGTGGGGSANGSASTGNHRSAGTTSLQQGSSTASHATSSGS